MLPRIMNAASPLDERVLLNISIRSVQDDRTTPILCLRFVPGRDALVTGKLPLIASFSIQVHTHWDESFVFKMS
jgi:hypothetical protein